MKDRDDISQKLMRVIRLLKEGAHDQCHIESPLKERLFSKEEKFEKKLEQLARYLKKNAK